MEITSLADLLDVQDLDLQIDRLLDRRKTLPELERFREAHEKQLSLENELADASTALKTLELDFDKHEGELEILESKLTEHETRLYAGGMSARETEYMRLEVQSLKGQRSAMEERVLSLLEDVDPARETVQKLVAERETVMSTKEALEKVIKTEWKQIDADLARKEEQKKEAVSPIPPELLEMYEKLRLSKEGVAIGRFEHGVCGGCHMALSAAESAEALDAEIPRCVHCRRILVP